MNGRMDRLDGSNIDVHRFGVKNLIMEALCSGKVAHRKINKIKAYLVPFWRNTIR